MTQPKDDIFNIEDFDLAFTYFMANYENTLPSNPVLPVTDEWYDEYE